MSGHANDTRALSHAQCCALMLPAWQGLSSVSLCSAVGRSASFARLWADGGHNLFYLSLSAWVLPCPRTCGPGSILPSATAAARRWQGAAGRAAQWGQTPPDRLDSTRAGSRPPSAPFLEASLQCELGPSGLREASPPGSPQSHVSVQDVCSSPSDHPGWILRP